MTHRTIFSIFFLGLVAMFGISACTHTAYQAEAQSAEAAPPQAFFIDLLYLNEGKTPADAKVYFDRVEPIVAEHGLVRIDPGFVVTMVMAGEASPDLVNVWTVSNPQTTFDDIFADPAYGENIPLRNATFDMSRTHMLMMKAAEIDKQAIALAQRNHGLVSPTSTSSDCVGHLFAANNY